MIKICISCLGELVPNDIVLDILKTAMLELAGKVKGFLIDGYPREKSQGVEFEKVIAPVTVSLTLQHEILFLDTW